MINKIHLTMCRHKCILPVGGVVIKKHRRLSSVKKKNFNYFCYSVRLLYE